MICPDVNLSCYSIGWQAGNVDLIIQLQNFVFLVSLLYFLFINLCVSLENFIVAFVCIFDILQMAKCFLYLAEGWLPDTISSWGKYLRFPVKFFYVLSFKAGYSIVIKQIIFSIWQLKGRQSRLI